MKRVRAAAALVALLVVAGCQKQAESSTHAGLEFKVDKLFTVDGCTVYRFSDGGYPRYFTNCAGSTSYETSSGKTTYGDGVQGGAQ